MKLILWVTSFLLANVLFNSVFIHTPLTAVFPFSFGAGNAVIRNLIVEEAKKNNVSTHLALALAYVESNFSSTAKNPNSSASGVFQWIKSSWASHCEGDVFDAFDNISCSMRVIGEGKLYHWLNPQTLSGLRREGVSDFVLGRYNRPEIARVGL